MMCRLCVRRWRRFATSISSMIRRICASRSQLQMSRRAIRYVLQTSWEIRILSITSHLGSRGYRSHGASPVFGSIGRGERHLEGVSLSLSALAPSFSRRANVAMMPAHVARFAPDATAQVGVSCLGYKAHFSEATEPRTIATVALAASWCGEIIQENLSQGSPNSLPKSSIRRKSARRWPRGYPCANMCQRWERSLSRTYQEPDIGQ